MTQSHQTEAREESGAGFEDPNFIAVAEAIVAREWVSEVLPALIGSGIGAAAVSLLTALAHAPKEAAFLGVWLLTIATFAGAVVRLLRQRTLQSAVRGGVYVALATLTCAFVPMLFAYGPREVHCAVLFAVSALMVVVPWPRVERQFFAMFSAMIALGSATLGPAILPWTIAGLAIVLWGMQRAARGHLRIAARASMTILVRECERSVQSVYLVRVLAWCSLYCADEQRAVVAWEDGACDVITRVGQSQERADPGYIAALLQKFRTMGGGEHLIAPQRLEEQLVTMLHDLFKAVPPHMVVSSVSTVANHREMQAVVMLPVRPPPFTGTAVAIFRVWGQLASVCRMTLAAARSRALTSDVLLSSEHTVYQREEDLNHVIHLANNIAQDISIYCDDLRGRVADIAEAQRLVETIEGCSRLLALGVSDVKWIKELLRMRRNRRVETVPLTSVLSELSSYAAYRVSRKGATWVDATVPEGAMLTAVSRELLGAALRLTVRSIDRRLDRSGRVACRAAIRADQVEIVLESSGEPAVVGPTPSVLKSGSDEEAVEALRAVARLSEGRFSHERCTGEFRERYVLTLPLGSAPAIGVSSAPPSRLAGEGAEWVLLVDDSADVISFYSRVAEALSLPFHVGTTLAEARAKLSSFGKPRLVITDIQLGAESGLDLVRDLRREFGVALPVIVVSGNTEDTIGEQVRAAGATHYLMKPVGRRKLFDEIRRLLGEGREVPKVAPQPEQQGATDEG